MNKPSNTPKPLLPIDKKVNPADKLPPTHQSELPPIPQKPGLPPISQKPSSSNKQN